MRRLRLEAAEPRQSRWPVSQRHHLDLCEHTCNRCDNNQELARCGRAAREEGSLQTFDPNQVSFDEGLDRSRAAADRANLDTCRLITEALGA